MVSYLIFDDVPIFPRTYSFFPFFNRSNSFWFGRSNLSFGISLQVVFEILSTVLVVSSQHIFLCFSFHSNFLYCRSSLACPSIISFTCFEFKLGFRRGTPILSQNNLASIWIWLFSSVMLLVEIFVQNSFTFSVSTFFCLVSWWMIM